jgi:hypothetical protein
VPTEFDVEGSNEVINFLVDHFGEARCIECDVRAKDSHYSYGPFAVSAKIDRQKATILFPAP